MVIVVVLLMRLRPLHLQKVIPPRRLFRAAGNVKTQAECLVMERGKCWGTGRLRTKLIVPWTFCECGRRHDEARHCSSRCNRGFGATIVLLTNIQILYGVC
uniref:Secreted protein n=1 Tax=Opuntia streptacantha TaxID=393608 RepID=A0A7C9CV79_OPUST